ncbi:unnamed protein product [Phaedon cochleariae]|uniref:Uncharacterized protein n=1 Tax=Phaedon cochleariae TaxID=80249 RepID=A0A9N9WZE1_PHACE|nr:unnamed protein product [Phaedon cochleariae]
MAAGLGASPNHLLKNESFTCKHCRKIVVNYVKCVKCHVPLHPSCLKQANQAKNPECLHTVEEICRVDAVSNEISFKLEVFMSENSLLKRIIMKLEEKNHILNENCQLLRDKIINIEKIHQSSQNEGMGEVKKTKPTNLNDKKTSVPVSASTSTSLKAFKASNLQTMKEKENSVKLSITSLSSSSRDSSPAVPHPKTEHGTERKTQVKKREEEDITMKNDNIKNRNHNQEPDRNKNKTDYDDTNNLQEQERKSKSNGDWKTVAYRRHKSNDGKRLQHKLSTGSRSNNEAMAALRVVNRLSWIYLSGFHPDTTNHDLLKCLDGNFAEQYICEQITKRQNPKMLSLK